VNPSPGAPRGFALWNLGFRPFYLLAGVFAVVALALWQPLLTRGTPLVWILHAAYAWLALYLILRALAGFSIVPLAVPAFYRDTVIVSGVLWAAAFAVFVGKYWTILTRPRVDGRSG